MAARTTMFAWQSPASSRGLDADLVFNPSAPVPRPPKAGPYTLVKVLRASLNPADIKVARSPLVAPMVKKPFTPGFDFAGTIASTTAEGFAPGDLVIGMLNRIPNPGALGEFVPVLPGDMLLKIPPSLRPRLDEMACCGVAAVTAYATTEDLPPGAKVLVNGSSGGAGTLAVQMAKAKGLTVVATCSSRNVELVTGLGADVVLDYTKGDVAEALAAHVKETGVPFARTLDNVGQPALYYQCHRWMAPEAEYVYVGGAPTLASMWGVAKMSLWPGFLGGGRRRVKIPIGSTTMDVFEPTVKLIAEGKVRVVLDQVYELDQVREAYKSLREGRSRGKKVIRVSEEEVDGTN